jgi:hypothetical protein
MSSLSERLRDNLRASNENRDDAPKGWAPGIQFDPDTGLPVAITTPRGAKVEDGDWSKAVALMGVSIPDGYVLRLVEAKYDPVAWTRETPDQKAATTQPAWRYKFAVVEASMVELDLPTLWAAAKKKPPRPLAPKSNDRVTVVALSDVQIGKTGSRGGTPELLDRLEATRAALDAHLKARRPVKTVLAEAGDLFEGFESGGNPMFTNDLSLSQQLDLAGTVVYEFVTLLAKYGPVDIVCVPSNHTAWRKGKQTLGRPGDDLGLLVHKQVEKIARAAGIDATWTYPAEYDEAVVLDINGTVLGLVHGNQYSPGGAPIWWGKQQHGGQVVGAADILVAGHYHQLNIMPTGRNPYTGRTKWFLQAPTADNGSDWYRTTAGQDSDPGLLVFDITDTGFDLTSLTVL